MAKQKILIVDDEAGMRELLNDILADMGCELHFAKDGKEGLDKALAIRPDVVLLDIMLPIMDGYQVCREIRARSEVAAIPVIMVTGNSTEESAKRGIEVGAEDVLAKPFNMSELKLRVKTILSLNRYRTLASERSQFKWVVENSESGYVMINKLDQVTYLNSKACAFFATSEDALAEGKMKFFDMLGNRYERVPDTAWESWPNLPPKSFLVRPETATTQALWLSVDMVPGSEDAGQRIVRVRDVTGEMMMYQNMWQFEHMVSHKLRTPLMGIIGSLEALESSPEPLNEENMAFVSEASEGARRLSDSIRSILEHLGSRKRREEDFVGTTLGSVENYANQLALTQGIDRIEVKVEPKLMMRELMLAKEDVLQILQEFYDNSVKFHPQNKPHVSVAIVAKDANFATLRVVDNGRSVDSVTLQKIGTPFFQAEKHFTGEVPGMGLGLSMINTMITTRGGACRIRNREDVPGLVIELDIPLIAE